MKAIGLCTPWQVARWFVNGAKDCMNMMEQLLWNVERVWNHHRCMDGGQPARKNGTCSAQLKQTPGILNWR